MWLGSAQPGWEKTPLAETKKYWFFYIYIYNVIFIYIKNGGMKDRSPRAGEPQH